MEEQCTLTAEKRSESMKNINRDGMLYSLMTGVGDAYLPAALVLMGAGDFYIGLLSALPQFFGSALQFVSLTVLRIMKDRKSMVMAGSFLQAMCWVPIILSILFPSSMSVPIMIIAFSVGTGITLMINPAWSSWVADIVPENERAKFFANRNRLMQVMLFVATFATGMIIGQLEIDYGQRLAFAAVFCIPLLARLSTVYFHFKTQNVPYAPVLFREIGLKHLFLLPAYKKELWFLGFVALMSFSVQFASPFFTPYMLNSLRMDVGMFGILTAIAIITKIVSYPYWGKAIDRFGNRTVLVTSAFMAPLVPLLWLFSIDPYAIALFQVFSGFIWSGYELAVFNSALSIVGRDLRPSFISKYNAFSAFANGLGAICGGAFLVLFPNAMLFGFSGILLVFLISGAMRIFAALLFAPKLATSKDVVNTSSDRTMIVKLVAIYPTQGAIHQVMDGWDFTRKIVRDGTESGGIALHAGLDSTGRMIREGGRKVISRISRRGKL